MDDDLTPDEHPPKAEVIRRLNAIIARIERNELTEDAELEMYQLTQEYETGEAPTINPEFVKYLITGWYVVSAAESNLEIGSQPKKS